MTGCNLVLTRLFRDERRAVVVSAWPAEQPILEGMMVKYVRGGRDGVQRILTQEEAEAEDRFNLKLAAAIILAVVVAVGIYVLLGGNVDSPLKKGALVLGSVIALFIGGRFYAWFWGIVGSVALLGLAGTVIYLVGRWILT